MRRLYDLIRPYTTLYDLRELLLRLESARRRADGGFFVGACVRLRARGAAGDVYGGHPARPPGAQPARCAGFARSKPARQALVKTFDRRRVGELESRRVGESKSRRVEELKSWRVGELE
eukprot:7849585-Pyramimonas_sp.AAC.2